MACTRGSRSALFVGALFLAASLVSGCKGGGGSNAGSPSEHANSAPPSSGKPMIEGVAPQTVAVNTPYAFRPLAKDPEGDTLTFQISNKPSWATFNTVTGELSGTPQQTGTFANIAISVSDGRNNAALAPFTIVVQPASGAVNAPGTGGVTISWIAPTERVDGAPLTNLSGFLIAYGTSENALSNSIFVDNPSVDRFVFQDLKPGRYYFAIRAVTTSGELSELSELKAKQIG
jgi:hypothetical protein